MVNTGPCRLGTFGDRVRRPDLSELPRDGPLCTPYARYAGDSYSQWAADFALVSSLAAAVARRTLHMPKRAEPFKLASASSLAAFRPSTSMPLSSASHCTQKLKFDTLSGAACMMQARPQRACTSAAAGLEAIEGPRAEVPPSHSSTVGGTRGRPAAAAGPSRRFRLPPR